MTRLDLSRLETHRALALTRRLLRLTPEGLEAMVAHGDRVLVYRFGPPWPGGRGTGARPLGLWRAELGPPGETCPLHLPTPPPGPPRTGDPGPPMRYWSDPVERGETVGSHPYRVRMPGWSGRV